MAKTKQPKEKKEKKEKVKPEYKFTVAPIYEIIKWIRSEKKPWSEIEEINRKKIASDKFMINRFLSMDLGLIEGLNDLQEPLSQMSGEMFYKFLLQWIPIDRGYYKYIKAEEEEYPLEDIPIFIKYFSVSRDIAIDYYTTMQKTEKGLADIERIKANYFYEVKNPTNFKI